MVFHLCGWMELNDVQQTARTCFNNGNLELGENGPS
jgi:hypothetical protein